MNLAPGLAGLGVTVFCLVCGTKALGGMYFVAVLGTGIKPVKLASLSVEVTLLESECGVSAKAEAPSTPARGHREGQRPCGEQMTSPEF